jgi:hypothetical protein
MTRTTLAIVLTATAALAGCNQGAQTNAAANEVANEAPIELPPAIIASKIYRCKDNSVTYIDWLSDNKSADIRTDKTGTPIRVTAPEAGKPMVAEGYSLTGTPTGAITLARPGKGSQSCHA